jgi:hypothetical protein
LPLLGACEGSPQQLRAALAPLSEDLAHFVLVLSVSAKGAQGTQGAKDLPITQRNLEHTAYEAAHHVSSRAWNMAGGGARMALALHLALALALCNPVGLCEPPAVGEKAARVV